MVTRLWQLYDERGNSVTAHGGGKYEAVVHGLLHGSAHLWIWRHGKHGMEILCQKRASDKINWPDMYDKTAGGHIGFGEDPMATAIRRAREEIGLTIAPDTLCLAGVHYWYAPLENSDLLENEYQWVYFMHASDPQFTLNPSEASGVVWRLAQTLKDGMPGAATHERYVPYGQAYYLMLYEALARMV